MRQTLAYTLSPLFVRFGALASLASDALRSAHEQANTMRHTCPSIFLWLSLLHLVTADSQSSFDYRHHHQQAAAKVGHHNNDLNGHATEQAPTGTAHDVPRVRESYLRQMDEPERWALYVPDTVGSVAAEISEARREAREMEQRKAEARRHASDVQQSPADAGRREAEGGWSIANNAGKVAQPSSKREPKAKGSALQRAAQRIKASTKRAERRALAKLEHFLDLDDDDDEHDDGHDYDLDDDGHESVTGEIGATYQKAKRKVKNSGPGFGSRLYSFLRSIIVLCYVTSRWSSKNLLWLPMTYAGEAIRWSAHTSWKTTRWTGERALVGPALTAGAPLIYLAEGLLFLFVWTPARVISVIVRELYPIYIYLGAALAVGTAMGIASAIILYIGSFFLSDSSTVEGSLARRAERYPEDLQKQYSQRRKSSSASKKRNGSQGESIIERAIQESLEREQRAKGRRGSGGYNRLPIPEESDEEDDYFGQNLSSSLKGKGRGNSNDITPTQSLRRTPAHFGPPEPLSLGTTNLNSSNKYPSRSESSSGSSPAISPATVRPNVSTASPSPYAYTSARGKPVLSPLISPDVVRSGSSRQRRGIKTSM